MRSSQDFIAHNHPEQRSSISAKVAHGLCIEYLRKNGYSYALSVLIPEAGSQIVAVR